MLAQDVESRQLFAVKQIRLYDVQTSEQDKRVGALEQEIALMKELDHPHIVRYVGTQRSAPEDMARQGGVGYLYIFLEYVPGGSVASR